MSQSFNVLNRFSFYISARSIVCEVLGSFESTAPRPSRLVGFLLSVFHYRHKFPVHFITNLNQTIPCN